jgi:hypothetical protein
MFLYPIYPLFACLPYVYYICCAMYSYVLSSYLSPCCSWSKSIDSINSLYSFLCLVSSCNLIGFLIRRLTLSLLMSYIYIYGASCKARNFNVVYIWTYVWQRWQPSLSICCTMFRHWISAERFLVSHLGVNTLPATKITLITDGI